MAKRKIKKDPQISSKKPVKSLKTEQEHRGRTANNIQSLGNLIFIGLIIPQFIPGGEQFNAGFAILGISSIGLAYYAANRIAKGGGK